MPPFFFSHTPHSLFPTSYILLAGLAIVPFTAHAQTHYAIHPKSVVTYPQTIPSSDGRSRRRTGTILHPKDERTQQAMIRKLAPVMPTSMSDGQTLTFEPVQKGTFDANGIELQERVNTSLEEIPFTHHVPALPHPEAILQDPLGWSSALRHRGIVFLFDNTNEFTGAITHPTRGYDLHKGSSNAGQYSFESDIDWETLAGIKGFETHAIAVGRYGIPASRMFGDNLNPSSEIYGGGGNVAVHLVFFYGEETLFHGRLNIAAGRMSFLSDFSSNPLYCTFMNNAFCGNPKASSDNYAHVSYPGSNWAMRIRARPTRHTYFQTGVYFPQKNVYDYRYNRTGFKYNGAAISGQSIPIEAGWEPEFGKQKLLGHYKIGFAIDTADHNSNYYDVNGHPIALTGNSPHVYHSAWAAWALADQMLLRHKTSDTLEGGLTLVAGAYFNQPRASTRAQFYEAALVDTGFWRARPLDTIGIGYSYTRISSSVTRTQRLQDMLNQPLMNDSYGIQRYGSTFEATYRIHVMRGITFAPDFQYYFRPGGQKRLRNAAMLGFKSHIQIF